MPSNSIWKGFELFIARAFKTERNPLSGANNYSDSGTKRAGDIVLPEVCSTLVECKTRTTFPKSGTFYRAEETMKEAETGGRKHWFHFERKKGNKKIYILATNEEWIVKICGYIRSELDKE